MARPTKDALDRSVRVSVSKRSLDLVDELIEAVHGTVDDPYARAIFRRKTLESCVDFCLGERLSVSITAPTKQITDKDQRERVQEWIRQMERKIAADAPRALLDVLIANAQERQEEIDSDAK